MAVEVISLHGVAYEFDREGPRDLPVKIGDTIVPLDVQGVRWAIWQNRPFKVVNVDGRGRPIVPVVDENGDAGTGTWYVSSWTAATRVEAPEVKSDLKVSDTVDLRASWCCRWKATGEGEVVHVTEGFALVRDKDGGMHIVSGRQHATSVEPFPGYKVAPSVKAGELVLIVSSVDYGSRVNGLWGYARYDYGAGADYMEIRAMGVDEGYFGGPTYIVTTRKILKAADVPSWYEVTQANMNVVVESVVGKSGKEYVGQTGRVVEWSGGYLRVEVNGTLISVDRWTRVMDDNVPERVRANPDDTHGASPAEHNGTLMEGDYVRVIATSAKKDYNRIGQVGVVEQEHPKRTGRVMVKFDDGYSCLVSEWCRVFKNGTPKCGTYINHVTEKEAAEILELVYETADKIADDRGWCNEYDYLMHKEVMRKPGTVRQFVDWEVDVDVMFDGGTKESAADRGLTQVSSRYRVRLKGARTSNANPHPDAIKVALEERGLKDIDSITLVNYKKV